MDTEVVTKVTTKDLEQNNREEVDFYLLWKEHGSRHPVVTCESVYLAELRAVLAHGEERGDRTQTGTKSLFGRQLTFDLTQGFPLLTTKRLPFRHVVYELFWFLSGASDTEYLKQHQVKIWEGNTTEEFIRKRGLSLPAGSVGKLYGYQWRRFGETADTQGVDQIQRVLDILRTDPTSRRMVISAWNPCDLDQMVLEPCHVLFQLYVRGGKYLDGSLYMRSNDLFLGAPWNIACYSLLIHLYAHLTGYTPGRLVYSIGDSHVYLNHVNQVEEQLSRDLRELPRVSIKDRGQKSFEDFVPEDIELHDYNPHPVIRGVMAV
jgi:thymidylate synthase